MLLIKLTSMGWSDVSASLGLFPCFYFFVWVCEMVSVKHIALYGERFAHNIDLFAIFGWAGHQRTI